MTNYIYEELRSGVPVRIGYFLSYQAEQYLKAEEYNSLNEDWEHLNDCLDAFEDLSVKQDPNSYFEAAVNLGGAVQRLKQSSKEKKPVSTDDKRFAALHSFNQTKKLVMYKAWSYASARWCDDTTETVRIGDMCDLVWMDLLQDADFHSVIEKKSGGKFIEMLPDNSQSIRPWLKPIAPTYAQKPGRKPKSRK